jgi:hypothetical protein
MEHGNIGQNSSDTKNMWQPHVEYKILVMESLQRNQYNHGIQGIVDSLTSLQKDLDPWGAKEFEGLAK